MTHCRIDDIDRVVKSFLSPILSDGLGRTCEMHKIRSVLILLCLAALAIVQLAPHARAADTPLTYFSDKPPFDFSKSARPVPTGQITVAKVRVMGSPAYLMLPDQSGRPPKERPRDPWATTLQVLDVVVGKRPREERVSVSYGGGAFIHTYIVGPRTLRQLAREYYVAMYEDTFGFHLIELPISVNEYVEWQREVSEYERDRLKPPPK